MSGGEEGPLISTWLTKLYDKQVKGSFLDDFFEFSRFDAMKPHLGLYQFEALCFALFIVVAVSIFVIFSARKISKEPGKLQTFLEMIVELIRGIVSTLMGEGNNKLVPYLGSLFLFILTMNLLGLIPLFRSPTMVLSVTFGLGVFTFLFVHYSGFKENGIFGHLKHFAGPILVLAPLFIVVETIGELVKPFSLSLRLYGNIYGEDSVIEQLLELGGGQIPLHLPILFLAIVTSLLQAFVFVALTSIYLKLFVSHDEH
jgi:F-type H+-transporting ATPase subunit a